MAALLLGESLQPADPISQDLTNPIIPTLDRVSLTFLTDSGMDQCGVTTYVMELRTHPVDEC